MEQNENMGSLDETDINFSDMKAIKKSTKKGRRYLNKLPLSVFIKLLANHFDIQFKSQSITWPKQIPTPAVI